MSDDSTALTPKELRLLIKFVVRNREEDYEDTFAANRRFVASLVCVSEALRDMPRAERKVALPRYLAPLHLQHKSLIARHTDYDDVQAVVATPTPTPTATGVRRISSEPTFNLLYVRSSAYKSAFARDWGRWLVV